MRFCESNALVEDCKILKKSEQLHWCENRHNFSVATDTLQLNRTSYGQNKEEILTTLLPRGSNVVKI
jgi:hypothetical protein